MANSLRDQLLKAGLVSKSKPESLPRPKSGAARGGPKKGPRANGDDRVAPPHSRNGNRRGRPQDHRSSGELDLARAYALRAKAEAAERRREQAEIERQARLRKERKQKLAKALEGASLNKPDVDRMRHFEYGGKIRRVHVDDDQLSRLNAGELAVVQQAGRYLLVTRQVAEQIRTFAPEHIALLVQPGTVGDDDGIPDDLVW